MPSRADIRPSDLRRCLDSIAMIDVLDGGAEFRYRVVGTLLTQYFLADPTGKTLTEAWPNVASAIAERSRANLMRIVQMRVPVYVSGRLDWPAVGPESFELLSMPLSDDGHNVNMVLSIFSFERNRALLDRQLARERGVTRLTEGAGPPPRRRAARE